jgi:hypothetical protein
MISLLHSTNIRWRIYSCWMDYSFGAGNGDFLIIKLNSSGNIQWSRAIGGTNMIMPSPFNKHQMEDI